MERKTKCTRKTKETDIVIELNLDGTGKYEIDTGVGFFDHMLEGFARHGFFDMKVHVKGDTNVDTHHTVEDTGIVLGTAFAECIKDKSGIARYGDMILPMDDALILASVDLCGRSYFSFDAELPAEQLGDFETETVREFFMGFASGAGMNLHIKQLDGINTHHIIETMFKAVSKAMDKATRIDERVDGVLSTKGSL